jgi:hypothetical protein
MSTLSIREVKISQIFYKSLEPYPFSLISYTGWFWSLNKVTCVSVADQVPFLFSNPEMLVDSTNPVCGGVELCSLTIFLINLLKSDSESPLLTPKMTLYGGGIRGGEGVPHGIGGSGRYYTPYGHDGTYLPPSLSEMVSNEVMSKQPHNQIKLST